MWALFRDYALTAPDAVSTILAVDRAGADAGYPDELVGRPIAYISYNHSGPAEAVGRDTAALFRGPKPLSTTVGSQPYLDVQTAHDLVLGWGHRTAIGGFNADDVGPEALDEIVELVATAPGDDPSRSPHSAAPSPVSPRRRPRTPAERPGSTSARTPAGMTRCSTRRTPTGSGAPCGSSNSNATLGRYSNENFDAGPEATRLIFGDAKLPRLAALKRVWDPDNTFHVNHNITPAADPG